MYLTYYIDKNANRNLNKMRQQRNILQVKESDKTLKEHLGEVHIVYPKDSE